MHSLIYTITTLLPAIAVATPFAAAPARRQAQSTACAKISTGYNEYISSPDDLPLRVTGELALECLQSMPLNQTLASSFLNETLKYIQWQSTLEALTHPPDTYLAPPTDILGGFEAISANISAGTYSSHYEFDRAIYDLVNSAVDGHFSISLCSLTIFQFGIQGISIVSISADGIEDPQVYSQLDAPLAGTSKDVSPITRINGISAVDYLETIASTQRSQDPDARYNGVFPSRPLAIVQDTRAGGAFVSNDGQWPGYANNTIEFKNGTTTIVPTVALYSGNSFNTTDGESLFQYFCLPSTASSSSTPTQTGSPTESETPASSPSESYMPTYTAGPQTYPTPFVRDPYNQMSGYELQSDDLNDTVVMFVPSFDAESVPNNQSVIIDKVATKIITQAVAANKSRIVIDVSGNGGGDILRGFNLFKLFFPGQTPYSATRFRNHASVELIGKVLASVNKTTADNIGAVAYRGAVSPNQKEDFASMAALYDGGMELGVNVSSLLANFNFTATSNEEDPISGYGGVSLPFSSRPFEPENIVIMSDGFCASTCTTFVNLMTNVGGVKSVVFGGRPNGNASMQIMGGVRGGQSASWGLIDEWVADAAQLYENDTSLLTPAEYASTNATIPIGINNMPLIVNDAGVNFRNAYQEGSDHMPLQFAYQAADCRRYYTAENLQQPVTQWEAAARAIWGNGTCVGGKGAAVGTATGSAGPSGTGSAAGGSTTQSGAAVKRDFAGSAVLISVVAGLLAYL